MPLEPATGNNSPIRQVTNSPIHQLPPDAQLHGVLVIDKPEGCTSHDVVARVRRALGESRIGHTGTLDPLATGVLPLVIGRATRLASMLSGADKQYEAGVRLGCATDTYDSTGRVIGTTVSHPESGTGPVSATVPAESATPAPEGIDRHAIEAALAAFRGTFEQTPPKYSAKKIDGVAAHRRARRDQDVEMRPVTVTVSELVLLGYADGLVNLRVTATAGFYVRSLAHDLGTALGCGAHLESLRRTRAGEFGLDQAVDLGQIQSEGPAAARFMLPIDRLLPGVPGVVLTERGTARARHGNVVGPEDMTAPATALGLPAGVKVRLLDGAGGLVGLAEPAAAGLLHPVVVLG
jgi:tRNA pseudouridine55 synthase